MTQIAAAVGALAIVGLVVRSFTGGSPSTGTQGRLGSTPSGPTPTVPGRPVFFFRIEAQAPATTGKPGSAAADDASIEIGGRLSTFYDTVFMDPNTWASGVPDGAWRVFAATVADRARGNADAFTLGNRAPGLTKLTVTKSSLTIRILLDPAGHPEAAIAGVKFVATGSAKDGQAVNVTNNASFLLRLEGGQWFVIGYPNAKTDVEVASPTPTPAGSASP